MQNFTKKILIKKENTHTHNYSTNFDSAYTATEPNILPSLYLSIIYNNS